MRRGRVRLAAFLMSLTLWIVVSYGTYESGGFHGSIMASYFAIVLIAQLLVSTRSGIVLGVLSILFTGWLVYADGANLLPPKAVYATLPTFWGEFSAVAIGMIVITSLVINSLREALARAHKNEQELAIKVAETQKLATELSENYMMLKSFVRRMGHETRTPMGAILGYAEILQEGDLTKRQKDQAGRIVENVNQLNLLFEGLLNTFQIEAGQLSLNKAEYKLSELIESIQANHFEAAQQKKLLLNVDVDEDMPSTLFGDKTKVSQILSNLLLNAIKFTDTGGIEVRFCKVDDTNWQFDVSDTGIGIPKESQGIIFEPFRQADESMTRKYGGLGLGLSVARELATLMGGSITVESELDKGSRFTVTLPF
jgi:signal transduction histidine kinase